MQIRPLTIRQANDLVKAWHRHHKPVTGARFALGVYDSEGVCHGAAIVGRPVARMTHPYAVAEVTRCVTDGTPNACSALYGAAARTAKAMGFERVQTFTRTDESGISLRAAGWVRDETYTPGLSWNRVSRSRDDKTEVVDRERWFVEFTANKWFPCVTG